MTDLATKLEAIPLNDMTLEDQRVFAEAIQRLRELEGALGSVLDGINSLMAESGGVYGLHLNGDPSPWEELVEGGRFESWLLCLSDARSALGEAQPASPAHANSQETK